MTTLPQGGKFCQTAGLSIWKGGGIECCAFEGSGGGGSERGVVLEPENCWGLA